MIPALARTLLGNKNARLIKSMQRQVAAVNALEPEMEALDDDALKAKTAEFRSRVEEGAKLDDLLPEAFAVVREASRRTLGMRHFDVQLIGGIVLHQGKISEMKTGEGKTLVATLAVYLNALSGKGVHVVTVNDYLAKRDAAWMGVLYRFLGLSVGCITNDVAPLQRKEAYASDITYGTNNEFGFDYLRDNMKYSLDDMVQRPFNFAIVDEVDSILIDEARTPLIISGPAEDSSELYAQINTLIPQLTENDYEKDEKSRSISLTEDGVSHVEILLKESGLLDENSSLYDINSVALVHHVNQALKAHHNFTADVDYIVKDGRVVIIDEFTGRMMEGRRYSEGLHQALEAKEGVRIQTENQTLASVTFQNYFRLYPKLAGMTGTALTEANEFRDIYGLEVVEIPTNVPVAREDQDDEIYRTAEEKHKAIVDLVRERHEAGQPLLVGTVSIERSELLSAMLKKEKIPHNVLNARYHEKEAFIIAQAGQPGAVTIATNMAGRGTDIKLGGNAEMLIAEKLGPDTPEDTADAQLISAQVEEDKKKVIEAGGLYVVGTERHESRRIDNQLRGRSGRQGDPGASKFFLSLEDDLMRIFGSERIDGLLQKMGLKEGEAIFHPWMNRALERAQSKVEARNYDMRKSLLKFDNVMNDQRTVIYEQRIDLMEADDLQDAVTEMREETNARLVSTAIPPKSYPEQWDMETLDKEIHRIYGIRLPVMKWAEEEGIADDEILERLNAQATEVADAKEKEYGAELMRMAEKRMLLQTLDQLWKDHLHSLDHLRQGISLRAFGQRDPLNEYKQEAFTLFEHMLNQLREEVTLRLAHMEIHVEVPEDFGDYAPKQIMHEGRIDPAEAAALAAQRGPGGLGVNPEMAYGVSGVPMEAATAGPMRTHVSEEDRDPNDPSTWGKVGRNEPCPCGSGKKFKHCHG